MKKAFVEKVLQMGFVDTAKYRYTCKECRNAQEQWQEIRRIEISKLGTTAALSDWETVATLK